MKILMIAPQPFLEPRGTPISVYQRARGLGELGHQVDLVTYHIGREVEIPGVAVHRSMPVPGVRQIRVGPSWVKSILDLAVLAKALELLAKNRYDVIHSHEEAAFFAVPLAALFRTKHLYDMHSSLPRQLGNFKFCDTRPMIRLFELLESSVITNADAVITIGADLEAYVRQMNPDVPQLMIENQAVNSIDISMSEEAVALLRDQLNIAGCTPVVYTGTFERYQGIELLIESAARIRELHPNTIFVMVGGKPQQVSGYRDMAVAAGVADMFIFTGIVPIEEVGLYTHLAEILVSPRVEGTSVPLKIYSYMHSGKPIVATNLIAHTTVLSEQIAVLTDPTSEAFGDGICRLLAAPALRRQIGEQARLCAEEKHSAHTYRTKLAAIYSYLQAPASVRIAG